MIWGRWTHWPIIVGNARLRHFARFSWSMQWSCRKCTCTPSWNFRYNSTESISLTVKGNVLLIAPATSRSGTVYCFSERLRPRHATSIPVPHSDDDYVVRAKFRCSCHWARELSQHLHAISPLAIITIRETYEQFTKKPGRNLCRKTLARAAGKK